MPVLGGRLQQPARARRVGRDADAVQVHQPEQVLGIGVPGVARGAEQLDRLVELQRAKRRACRLERIFGLDPASPLPLPHTGR